MYLPMKLTINFAVNFVGKYISIVRELWLVFTKRAFIDKCTLLLLKFYNIYIM